MRSQPARGAGVHEATDSVDDGLALVRRWEQQGVTRFRGVAHDLFDWGGGLDHRYEPHSWTSSSASRR